MTRTKSPPRPRQRVIDLRVATQDAALLLQAQRCIESTSTLLGGSRNIILGILQDDICRQQAKITRHHMAIEAALEQGGAE